MRWTEVHITVGPKTLTGPAARNHVRQQFGGRCVGDKVPNSVVLVGLDGVQRAAVDEVKAILREMLGAANVRFAGEPRPALPVVVNAHRGPARNHVVRPPPQLLMFMNGDRRLTGAADPLIDDVPTANGTWLWGVAQHGAIIAVKTRVYANPGDPVAERSLLRLVWRNDVPGAWTATLAVDHADRIRICRDRLRDGDLLLGDAQAGPLQLDADPAISAALVGVNHFCDLWMEAIDYPETAPEADWLVRLTLAFTHPGGTTNQQALVRIAPWIMASDLDQTQRVYVRTTTGIADDASTAVMAFGAVAYEVGPDKAKKGFARDVMKTGYSAAPHDSGIVIQDKLDGSPLELLPSVAAQDSAGGTITKPRVRAALLGQDNGGNLIVSPPTVAFPWGRILYGASPGRACQSSAFYSAQKLQRPIELNSTWLRVGHVDEMLSIVRNNAGAYKALLLSPRLGYIMLRGVADGTAVSAAALVNWATGINTGLINAGAYDEGAMTLALNAMVKTPVPANYMSFHAVAATGDDPPVPAHADGLVVMRLKDDVMPRALRGTVLNGPLMAQMSLAFPEGAESYELRFSARRLLARAEATQLELVGLAQPALDGVRATLINDLGFLAADIIEVPAILNYETNGCVALTGDSVNLLQRVAGPLGASNCLVPKPFGPVHGGAYVYETHLSAEFAHHGIAAAYCADDRYHLDEGEIHCATNQTHPPLAGNLQRWWEWVAP